MSAHLKPWLAAPCEACDGSGLLSDRHPLDPAGKDYQCSACEGSGLSCEGCREMKEWGDLCGGCSIESVEALYA